jgi:undecaprenyl-diphosphatase
MEAAAVLASLDRAIFLVVNRTFQNPLFDLLMPALSDKWLGLALAAVVAPWLLVRYRLRAWPVLLAATLAIALSDLGAGLMKHAVQRVRPCHVVAQVHLLAGCTRSFAMPSNHAINMFALVGVFMGLLPGWRWPVLLLATGVAYSRIYLGVHYPSDVVVGAGLGMALGWGLALVAKRVLPAAWMAVEASARTPDGIGTERPNNS